MNALPSGVEPESSGDAEVIQDVFSGFAGVLGTAVLFIYAVLVLLFANFLNPVTIMAALPLSLGGALLFGKPMYEATLDSGVARLRPILIDDATMIAGMVPIALGIGALMTSWLLTLVVIPLVFTYMDGLPIWIFNRMRGTGKKGRAIDSIGDNWAIEINCSKYSRGNPPAVDPVSIAEGSKAH